MSDNEPDDLSKLPRDFGLDLGVGPMALKIVTDWRGDDASGSLGTGLYIPVK